jgi:plasmid stabilization system protein ParE
MKIQWTNKALSDLERVYEFLATVNKPAAIAVVRSLTNGVTRLTDHPRLGESLSQFDPRDVRRLQIGRYEVRYEIQESVIFILRLWHTREDR